MSSWISGSGSVRARSGSSSMSTISGMGSCAARAISPATSSAISAFAPWPAPRNLSTYMPSSSASTMAGSEPPSCNGVTYRVAPTILMLQYYRNAYPHEPRPPLSRMGVSYGRFPLVRLATGVIAFALVFILGICRTAGAETLAHGRFKHVEIFRPQGEVKHFALLMSGDGGWSFKLATIAGVMASEGTLVAGIDTSELFADLEKDGGSCVSPDGDLENLSHYVQAYYKVPTYFTPILIGHSAGATLAYTTLAQAPAGISGGALTLSFCVELDLRKPLCQAQGLQYRQLKNGARLLPPPQLHAPCVAWH